MIGISIAVSLSITMILAVLLFWLLRHRRAARMRRPTGIRHGLVHRRLRGMVTRRWYGNGRNREMQEVGSTPVQNGAYGDIDFDGSTLVAGDRRYTGGRMRN